VPAVVTAGGPSDEPEAEGLTRTGHLAGGTPGFLAPEQIDERFGEVGPAADVWGLGACLYAFLTGHAPFPGGKAKMGKVATDPLVPPQQVNPAVPADLAAIVLKCLEKEQSKRYPTAAAVAADLDRYLTRDETAARPRSRPARVWQRLRRTPRAVVIAVAVAVLAVAVGVTLAMVPKRTTPSDPLTQLQEKLAGGQEVVLVDAGKLALPPSWLLADAVLTGPTADEPYLSFLSRDRAMLVLSPDPGVDRYRIVARVRQLEPPDDAAEALTKPGGVLGVFWAYREGVTPEGHKGKAYMAFEYSDFPLDPSKRRRSHLTLSDRGDLQTPLRDPRRVNAPLPKEQLAAENLTSPFHRMQENAVLDLVPKLPGPARTLVIDVTPDGITVHFPTGPRAVTAAQLAGRCERLESDFRDQIGGRPLGTQTWSPRSPVGVSADRCRVAVERFVLQPLPPP
jgi:hypothetical protein